MMFEGIAPGVEAQVKSTVAAMGRHGDVEVFDEEGMPLRRPLSSSAEGETVVLKIAAVPSDLPHLLRHVFSLQDRSPGLASRLTGHAGSGITFVELTGDKGSLVEAIREIRQFALERGGSAVVRRAPLQVKQAVEVWGPVGDALPLMQRVKAQFDPDGMMSPGRFVGGI
jgi:glycolate oxidase FAD binding subunit